MTSQKLGDIAKIGMLPNFGDVTQFFECYTIFGMLRNLRDVTQFSGTSLDFWDVIRFLGYYPISYQYEILWFGWGYEGRGVKGFFCRSNATHNLCLLVSQSLGLSVPLLLF